MRSIYAGVRQIASTPCRAGNSEQKRAAILQAAVAVFSKGGYEAAGMDAIAAEAGVAKQTIYNHFGSKDGLFRAIVADLAEELLATLPTGRAVAQAALPAGGAPRQVLRALGRQFVALMLRPSSLALHRLVVAEAERFPELARELYWSGPDHAVRSLAGWLAGETAKGTLAVTDPGTAAEQFYGMLMGHMQLRALLCVDPDPCPARREHAVEAAVDAFLQVHGARRATGAAR
ncbi:MAG: TetR/AcrR family transcriptional regulator [Alphaproteobacteria bacterium]